MNAEAIIVVGPVLWKCVNCNLRLSWHHSVDQHLLSRHRSGANSKLNLESHEEGFCNIVGCACKGQKDRYTVVVDSGEGEISLTHKSPISSSTTPAEMSLLQKQTHSPVSKSEEVVTMNSSTYSYLPTTVSNAELSFLQDKEITVIFTDDKQEVKEISHNALADEISNANVSILQTAEITGVSNVDGEVVSFEEEAAQILLDLVEKSNEETNRYMVRGKNEVPQTVCLTFEKTSDDLPSTLCYIVEKESEITNLDLEECDLTPEMLCGLPRYESVDVDDYQTLDTGNQEDGEGFDEEDGGVMEDQDGEVVEDQDGGVIENRDGGVNEEEQDEGMEGGHYEGGDIEGVESGHGEGTEGEPGECAEERDGGGQDEEGGGIEENEGGGREEEREAKEETEERETPAEGIPQNLCGIVFDATSNKSELYVSSKNAVPKKLSELAKLALGDQSSDKCQNGETVMQHGIRKLKTNPEEYLPKDYSIVALHGYQIPTRFADEGKGLESFNLNYFLKALPTSIASMQLINFIKLLTAYDINLTVQEDGGFLFDYNKVDSDDVKKAEKLTCYCTICTNPFQSLEKFLHHLLVSNHGTSPHMCGNCLKLFHNAFALHLHQLTHHFNMKTHLPCLLCSSKLKDYNSMRAHMNIHRQNILKFKGIEIPSARCGELVINLMNSKWKEVFFSTYKVSVGEQKALSIQDIDSVKKDSMECDSDTNESKISASSTKSSSSTLKGNQQRRGDNRGFLNVVKIFATQSHKNKASSKAASKHQEHSKTRFKRKWDMGRSIRGTSVMQPFWKRKKMEKINKKSEEPEQSESFENLDDSLRRRSSRANKGKSSQYKDYTTKYY